LNICVVLKQNLESFAFRRYQFRESEFHWTWVTYVSNREHQLDKPYIIHLH
jgi:hypothetical protein